MENAPQITTDTINTVQNAPPPPHPYKGRSRESLQARRAMLEVDLKRSLEVLDRGLARATGLGFGKRLQKQASRLRFLRAARQEVIALTVEIEARR